MYNRFVVYSRWGSVWIGINWDPKSLSLCDMCYVVFDFSLCQINEFFNCGCRFVVYTCSSSVWIGDNIWDPKIFMHLDLHAADYVVVYVGRHMCILALFR